MSNQEEEIQNSLLSLVEQGAVSDSFLESILQLADKSVESDPETFVIMFMSNFNFRNRSTFHAIMSLVNLTKLNTLESFSQTDVYQQIGVIATRYLGTLLCEPSIFDPSCTINSVIHDFYTFFITQTFTNQWLTIIAETISTEEGNHAISRVLSDIANSVRTIPIGKDLNKRILIFSKIIYCSIIRAAFVNSPFFSSSIHALFTKSIFFLSNNSSFSHYFKTDSSSPITNNERTMLNNAMRLYHDALLETMTNLLYKNTFFQTMDFIQESLKFIENAAKLYFTRPNDNDEAFAFNFESILIRLTLKAKTAIQNRREDHTATVNPLTPFYTNSIVSFPNDGEIALKGGKCSWIDRYNQSQSQGNPIDDPDGPSISEINEEWAKILTPEVQNKDKNAVRTDLFSQLFFAAVKASVNGTVKLFKLREKFMINIQYCDDEIARVHLRLLAISIIELLILPFRKDDWVNFLQTVAQFVIQESKFDGIDLPPYPPNIYAHLPESLISLLSSTIFNLYQCYFLNENEIFGFLKPFVVLSSNRRFIRNPMIKSTIIRLFSFIAREKNQQHFIVSIPHILDQMFPSVIDFFNYAQNTGSHTQFYDKFNFRRDCNILLSFWFRLPSFQEYFAKNFDLNPSFQVFIYYLVSDAIYYASEAFNALSEAILQEENIFDESEIDQSHELLYSASNAQTWFKDLDINFKLINQIVNFASFVFDGPLNSNAQAAGIPDQVAILVLSIIEKSLNSIVHFPKTAKIASFNRNELIFSSCNLLITIFQNKDNPKFPISFAKNPQYKPELISNLSTFVGSISREYGRNIDADIAQIGQRLEQIKAEIDQQVSGGISELIENNIPELTDPVTYELLKDPVLSPASDLIYSLQTLAQAFLNRPNLDPLAMKPLRLDDCKPHLPTKAALSWFLKKGEDFDFTIEWNGKDKKFIDIITNELLEDPVLLPSGNYLSLKTVKEQNITEDPVTHQKFDPNTAVVDSEMKLVVEWYKYWMEKEHSD